MQKPAKWGVAAVIVVSLSVGGCTRALPPGPTDEEIAASDQDLLDKTWKSTGLEGIEPRPVVASGEALADQDWFAAVFDCLSRAGVTVTGLSYGSAEGFSILTDAGEPSTDIDEQLATYRCVAAHPSHLLDGMRPYSRAQLDFIYDYYRDWLIPCLSTVGYTVTDAPTREWFVLRNGQWNPYWALPLPNDGARYDSITAAYGPEQPPLD